MTKCTVAATTTLLQCIFTPFSVNPKSHQFQGHILEGIIWSPVIFNFFEVYFCFDQALSKQILLYLSCFLSRFFCHTKILHGITLMRQNKNCNKTWIIQKMQLLHKQKSFNSSIVIFLANSLTLRAYQAIVLQYQNMFSEPRPRALANALDSWHFEGWTDFKL